MRILHQMFTWLSPQRQQADDDRSPKLLLDRNLAKPATENSSEAIRAIQSDFRVSRNFNETDDRAIDSHGETDDRDELFS